TQGASPASFAGNGSIVAGSTDTASGKGVLIQVVIPAIGTAFGGHALGYSDQASPKWLIGLSRGAENANTLSYFEDSSASQGRFALKPGGVIAMPFLPTHADDTAAGSGGLAAGDLYKTSTGECRIKL
ncbi:MAG TPA: hypothetical protein VF695_13080, partial [Sphingomonas sp.]